MEDCVLKRTWAEINLDNLAHNLDVIQKQVGKNVKLLGVVKADAYGHGAVRIARELEQLGASYLAVSSLDECEELRANGIKLPILMLGFTPIDQATRILECDVTQAIQSYEIAKAFSDAAVAAGKTMTVHIKLNTGMGRLGFPCNSSHFDDSVQAILDVLKLPGLYVEGIFTHFSVSDEPDDLNVAFTYMQHNRFTRMVAVLEEKGNYVFPIHHCCNAGAIANYHEWAWDMVRCGIILYGSGDMAEKLDMKPVMTVKSKVSTIETMGPGTSIGYGRTFITEKESRIAVLPIGYADGLFRNLSDKLQVMTPYGVARQVGRICMDMCMIDVTDQPELQSGDEVEIFGEHMLLNTNAKAAETISYELLCAVSKRVPRYYYRNGECVDYNLQMLF